ncbi:MAG TPA: hypothetical protein VFI42_14485 [Thermomicrobiaceae bacterium]|nr:hypothetical protein [Thermomicrobiaceae bacterium]
MITILHGTDQLTIAERLRDAKRTLDPQGINTTVVEQARQHLPDVQAASGALGFFGAIRLVIAYDLFLEPKSSGQSSGSGGRGRGAKKPADDEAIVALLAGVPESTQLVAVERTFGAQVEKLAAASGAPLVLERHDVPRGPALLQWVSSRARQHGAEIDTRTAEAVVEALFPGSWQSAGRYDDVPPDLFRLDSEIAKLSAAAGAEGHVTSEHVLQLVPGADAENIWGLTDAIAAGSAARAINEVERAIAHGTAPEALLGQLTGHFETIAAIHAAGRGSSAREIAAATGLSDGRVRMATRGAERTTAHAVVSSLDALRSLDADAKRGKVELDDALVALVAKLASRQLD